MALDEIFTRTEIERRAIARKASRYGHRDATMVLIAFFRGKGAIEVK
jgi:hypothetical protein